MKLTKSEATKKGMQRAKRLGRRLGRKLKVTDAEIRKVLHLGTAEAAAKVGLSKSRYIARRRAIEGVNNDE